MSFFRRIARTALVVLCALTLVISASLPTAMAGMIGTDSIIEQQEASAERERIQALLEREEVQAELAAYGVDPEEAKARVGSLSDMEVRQLAGQIPDEPAGEGVGTTLIAVGLVFVAVLVFTDFLGLTNVFTFIRS